MTSRGDGAPAPYTLAVTRTTLHGATPPAAPPAPASAGTPLYVHLPFCAAKCHYCDFFSVPDEGQDVDGLLDALAAEAAARAPRSPRTVFLGGGTPSLLSIAQLARLLDRLDALTGFRSSAVEVTAECNPESLDFDKARALLDLGVGRISIGVQSLHDEVLRLFGRVHTVADSFRAIDAARRAGVRDLNLDLIYAVPGQSVEEWRADLERVLDLEPEHLSAYNLTFEEDTRFRRWLEQGRIAKAPEEVELACFHATRERATARGLEPYEVSNYARPGRECRHNLGYWANGEYVGIGPGAVGKVGATRAGNVKAIAAYRRWIAGHRHATAWSETPGPRARLAETWWLGLRRAAGVAPEEARAAARFDGEPDPALPIVARLARSGHVEERGGRWRLTPEGLPVADAVASELLARLTDSENPVVPAQASLAEP